METLKSVWAIFFKVLRSILLGIAILTSCLMIKQINSGTILHTLHWLKCAQVVNLS